MGEYNLNNLNFEKRGSLETILRPFILDVADQSIPTHSETLMDYIISD